MTKNGTINGGSVGAGGSGCLRTSPCVGEVGEVGEGVFEGVRFLEVGEVGEVGEGVFAISNLRYAQNIYKYNVFHAWVRWERAFPILSLYISYFLFSFLQSRRGEKTLTHLTQNKRDSKTGNKEEEGILI